MRPETGSHQTRALTFKREAVNVDARTVELAFASETPYERFWGVEILDCSVESVDLSRLNDAAPLLDCHDPDEQIGVIDRAWIGPDRICRATVRFSRSKDAEEVFQDVIDGIRQKVSVGYTIDEIRLESSVDGLDTYRVMKWTPLEVSIVSIPADSTVGVGRAAAPLIPSQEKSIMAETPVAPAAPTPTVVVDDTATRRLAEVREILATGEQYEKHGGRELASKAIQEGHSVKWLGDELLKRMASQASPAGAGEIGMTPKETRQYSLTRLLRAMCNPQDSAFQRDAGLEMEAHRAAAGLVGQTRGGFIVPFDVLKRDMTAAGSSGSNYLVGTTNMPGGLIDLLRNRMVVTQLGAVALDGLVGNVTIPKLTAASTLYWLSTESTTITESQPTIGQLALSPKNAGGRVQVSRQMMMQSTPAVDSLVQNDLLRIAAIGIDKAALNGSGSSGEPTGVSATSGIGSVTGTSLAYEDIIEFTTDVAASNALADGMAYVTTPAVAGLMKQRQRFSSTDTPLWTGKLLDGEMEGYRAVATQQIAAASMIFGDWSQIILASWGGLELASTNSDGTDFQSGITSIRVMLSVDVGVRIPAAFSQATSIT